MDHEDAKDYRTQAGWTLGEVAASARDMLYALTTNEKHLSWDDLPEETRDRWLDAVGVCLDQRERESEVSWSVLTARVFRAYHATDTYGTLPVAMKYAWEAVVRHTINLLSCEDADDVRDAQESVKFWQEWFLDRIKGKPLGGRPDDDGDEESPDSGEGAFYTSTAAKTPVEEYEDE